MNGHGDEPVIADMSMSLDGFVADPNDGVEHLFGWYGNRVVVTRPPTLLSRFGPPQRAHIGCKESSNRPRRQAKTTAAIRTARTARGRLEGRVGQRRSVSKSTRSVVHTIEALAVLPQRHSSAT